MSTLLVSSVGGHLAELHRLVPRFEGIDSDRMWVTFDTPQSRSILQGENVVFVDYTAPRDLKNVVRHTGVAMRLFRGQHPFTTVLSAGSGIALSFLPLARARGASCHFIESATRSTGPSLTGRLLRRVPGIVLYSQHRNWARAPWRYEGSVLDGYAPAPPSPKPPEIGRIVVMLGTMPYPFRRFVERLIEILPRGLAVDWQVGHTDVEDLAITAQRWLPGEALQRAIGDADVVVAHAGMGSALAALDAGKCPILVPRLSAFGENIDDHQLQIASELTRRGLAVVRSVEELDVTDLYEAATRPVLRNHQPMSFRLSPGR